MSLGEFDIIARYFAKRSARGDVLLGIGDDAAVLEVARGSQAGRRDGHDRRRRALSRPARLRRTSAIARSRSI